MECVYKGSGGMTGSCVLHQKKLRQCVLTIQDYTIGTEPTEAGSE